ncbi:MAG: sterol desaturase family protein [Burkholderiaceae bacterium]
MYETVIQYATPVFFLLIGVELAASLASGRRVYRLNDALSSIGLGVFSQVAGAFARVLVFGIYALTWEHLALLSWPRPWHETLWALPLALLLYDFCYYWHHRWMHEIAIAWAAHVVHHSSEDYNLSTALRQTATGPLLGWIPYLPMALLGVPPSLYLSVALIDLLYQFWIHTEMVGRLGWFDRVFASPSNHRVHHAVNDRYIDRNYGGILIVWDRLFGTFQEERDDDPAVYGTRAPLRSFDPVWANLEVYAQLARVSRQATRWRDRIAVWFRHPGWRPPELAHAAGRAEGAGFRLDSPRYDPPSSGTRRAYALLQFVATLAMTVHFGQFHQGATLAASLAYALYLLLALTAIGAALQGRHRWLVLDGLRHLGTLVLASGLGQWFGDTMLAPGPRLALALVSVASLVLLWRVLAPGSLSSRS